KVVGPYLNFFINNQQLAKITIETIQSEKEKYGRGKTQNEKIMVEYSSPNTNKAQHLGHVRNNLLGMALSTILKYSGYDVLRTCLMNDKGMGIAQSMLAYKLWGNNEKPDVKSDHFVAKWYVEFGKRVKDNPELEKQAQELNELFEEGDEETLKLWKTMSKWVYDGYDVTYKRLGCVFDKTYYESAIYKKGKDIVQRGWDKGIFEKEDGAVVAKLEQFKMPDKFLLKSDGTSLYVTQDIYLAELKEKEFNMDRSIYVVASEQNLHFEQLFAILKLLGHSWADKCYHLSYGMINLPSGKMKSREGTVVDADDLMDDMEKLAETEIRKRHDLPEDEIKKRAKQIGIGALKFYILKYEPSKDFMYNPEESI
ncbi:MAG: arginine--tRNA ligase, partial [Candidatus Heimdallarchaeota archaeon]|nr:arginine--tRNA ligase [Candidatus Heimdallarchaeota archaeon]